MGEYNKSRYYRLKEKGICVRCGRNLADPGRTQCFDCSDKKSKKRYAKIENDPEFVEHERQYNRDYRAEKIKKGICTSCSAPAVPGRKHCAKHLLEIRNHSRYEKHLMQQLGKCPRCHKPNDNGGSLCNECRRKEREQRAEKKAALAASEHTLT